MFFYSTAILVLELFDRRWKIICDGEDGIQLRDDQQFFNFIAYAADCSIAAILAALGKDVYQNIKTIAIQITEMLHRDNEAIDSFIDIGLNFIEQWSSLIFIDQIPAHFNNGIRAIIGDFVIKFHGVKLRVSELKAKGNFNFRPE